MGNGTKNDEESASVKRAADFSDAMLNIPAYADDTMFFIIRYVGSAKEKLRDCEFQEFMIELNKLDELDDEKKKDPESGPTRQQQALAHKQKAFEVIKDYPDLVHDFEQFCTRSRSFRKTMKSLS